MSRAARRRRVTESATSRSSRAWWVPPAPTSENPAATAAADARMASSRAYAASMYDCSAASSGWTGGVSATHFSRSGQPISLQEGDPLPDREPRGRIGSRLEPARLEVVDRRALDAVAALHGEDHPAVRD